LEAACSSGTLVPTYQATHDEAVDQNARINLHYAVYHYCDGAYAWSGTPSIIAGPVEM
jgi:hypothetical protein